MRMLEHERNESLCVTTDHVIADADSVKDKRFREMLAEAKHGCRRYARYLLTRDNLMRFADSNTAIGHSLQLYGVKREFAFHPLVINYFRKVMTEKGVKLA